MKRYWNGKRTVAAFVAATFWLFSTLAAFAANDETSRSSTSPVEPFASTAKIDPQTTVFLYLADAADENLRRIYVEYNKTIQAAVDEAAGGDAFKRFLKEEEERERAKLAEIKKRRRLNTTRRFARSKRSRKRRRKRRSASSVFTRIWAFGDPERRRKNGRRRGSGRSSLNRTVICFDFGRSDRKNALDFASRKKLGV